MQITEVLFLQCWNWNLIPSPRGDATDLDEYLQCFLELKILGKHSETEMLGFGVIFRMWFSSCLKLLGFFWLRVSQNVPKVLKVVENSTKSYRINIIYILRIFKIAFSLWHLDNFSKIWRCHGILMNEILQNHTDITRDLWMHQSVAFLGTITWNPWDHACLDEYAFSFCFCLFVCLLLLLLLFSGRVAHKCNIHESFVANYYSCMSPVGPCTRRVCLPLQMKYGWHTG